MKRSALSSGIKLHNEVKPGQLSPFIHEDERHITEGKPQREPKS